MICELCQSESATPTCSYCQARIDAVTSQLLRALTVHVARHLEYADRSPTIAQDEQSQAQLTPDTKPAPEPAEEGKVAAGDGAKAEQLLASGSRKAQQAMAGVVKSALTRHLKRGGSVALYTARDLFSPQERDALSQVFGSILAPANLLGRARVRKRIEPAGQFAEWQAFDDGGLKPMPPEKAVGYFKGLVPALGTDPQRFGQDQRRRAFTLAVATEKGLLNRVKGVLVRGLEEGTDVESVARQVQGLMDRAGVSSRNPAYTSMVVRTNLMDAYNQGQQEELSDPDVAEAFPVWRYDGIEDGRERDSHRVHFGHYFPRQASFNSVRDSVKGSFDGYQCRCTMTPIGADEWEELVAQGAKIAPGYEGMMAKAVVREKATAKPQPEPTPQPEPVEDRPAAVSPEPVQPSRPAQPDFTPQEIRYMAREAGVSEEAVRAVAGQRDTAVPEPAAVEPAPVERKLPTTLNGLPAVQVQIPRKGYDTGTAHKLPDGTLIPRDQGKFTTHLPLVGGSQGFAKNGAQYFEVPASSAGKLKDGMLFAGDRQETMATIQRAQQSGSDTDQMQAGKFVDPWIIQSRGQPYTDRSGRQMIRLYVRPPGGIYKVPKNAVQTALDAGHDVPPEVLADYPDIVASLAPADLTSLASRLGIATGNLSTQQLLALVAKTLGFV